LSLASGASAVSGGQASDPATQNTGPAYEITLRQEEIADISLATLARVIFLAVLPLLIPISAAAGEYQNLDAMGLASGKGMRTRCEAAGQYEGKTYCFHDEGRKRQFMADPAGNRTKADSFYTPIGRRAIIPFPPASPTAANNANAQPTDVSLGTTLALDEGATLVIRGRRKTATTWRLRRETGEPWGACRRAR